MSKDAAEFIDSRWLMNTRPGEALDVKSAESELLLIKLLSLFATVLCVHFWHSYVQVRGPESGCSSTVVQFCHT